MTHLLLRLFIKVPHDPEDPGFRAACGRLAGAVGIVCNALLFLLKLLAGLLSGSVSVLADAVNNLTDASSSVITLLGFRIAELPPDPRHPYGHARVEYLTGLAIAALILVLGFELARSSFLKILHPETVTFTVLTVTVLILSIFLKLWLAGFCRRLGSAIHSVALEASACDSRNDVISTSAVLGAGLLSLLFPLKIDGFVGLVVAGFILFSAVQIGKDAINPLLGEAPDPRRLEAICRNIRDREKVLGVHDLILHDYGPGRQFASIHVEMDYREDPLVCHNIIDSIEQDFRDHEHLNLVIHMDPVVTDDPELSHLRQIVEQELQTLDQRLSLHDFRLIRSPGVTKVLFDLSLPYALRPREQNIHDSVAEALSREGAQYLPIITYDEGTFH